MGLRERKREQLIQRIESVTLDLIQTSGFEALTVEAILQQVEVSPPTFYKHFSSKEDVLRRIAGNYLREGLQQFVERAQEPASLRQDLQDFFLQFASWVHKDKPLWRAIVLADALNPFRWPEQKQPESDVVLALNARIQLALAQEDLVETFPPAFSAHSLVSIQIMTLLEWSVSDLTLSDLEQRLLLGVDFVLAAMGVSEQQA